jgi:hypothetical protein
MGRHSAPSRTKWRVRHTLVNSVQVLLVTAFVTAVIYAGIAMIAVAKNDEIPPPALAAQPSALPPTAPDEQVMGGMQDTAQPASTGGLRRCPATGCAASTCHAETGEPPPRH